MAWGCDEDNIHYKRFMMWLRWFGGCCGLASIIIGIIQFVQAAGNLNPRYYINAAYQIIFGVLIICCEFRVLRILVYTRFLTHFFGLGMFYIFVGGLGIGSIWYQYMVGAILIGVGACYLILGLFNHSMYEGQALRDLEAERVRVGIASAKGIGDTEGQSQPQPPRQQGVELKLHATGNDAVDRHIDAAASSAANREIEKKKKELNPWDRDNNQADKGNPFDQM